MCKDRNLAVQSVFVKVVQLPCHQVGEYIKQIPADDLISAETGPAFEPTIPPDDFQKWISEQVASSGIFIEPSHNGCVKLGVIQHAINPSALLPRFQSLVTACPATRRQEQLRDNRRLRFP